MTKPLPAGPFSCIVADPPWKYRTFSAKGGGRGAEQHYPTMKLDEIKAMPVASVADRDCHLFLWATGPNLREAFAVMDAWGFKYSALGFVWVKQNLRLDTKQLRLVTVGDEGLFLGMGHTTRQNAELVLLGRRGRPKRTSKKIRQVIMAPRREHSRKPDEVLDRIEAYCAGPYLELFSRSNRPGWTAWGNEAGKFTEATPPRQPNQHTKPKRR